MADNARQHPFSTTPSGEFATELERAIVDLERAIEEHPTDESIFQSLFEERSIILYALGYSAYVPRPRMLIRQELQLGRYYEPDFLTTKPSGLSEIVDLKTPAERVLLDRPRREHFTSKLAEYVSQIQDYREYFDEYDHRAATEANFGVVVQQRPDSLIIVGRESNTDKRELHRQLERSDRAIRILTFDDVLAELERTYVSIAGTAAALPGATVMLKTNFTPYKSDRRRYLCDIRLNDPASRWSIYLSETDDLVFEITEGIEPNIRVHAVRALSGTPGFGLDQWMLVSCEFGTSERRSFLRIRVDDQILAENAVFTGISVGSELLRIGVEAIHIGSDSNGQRQCNCGIGELRIYDVAFGFRERLAAVAEYSR